MSLRSYVPIFLIPVILLLGGCGTAGRVKQGEDAEIHGKTYVLFGASSGLGRGVALELARRGAKMVLAARREALLDEVAVEANSMGGEAIPIVADISDPADGASVARAAMVRFGGIDVWINFAGIGAIGRFWEIPLEDHVRLVEINLLGTCRLMRRATDIGLSSALSLILTLIIAAFDVILGGTAILRHLLRYVRFRDWCSS